MLLLFWCSNPTTSSPSWLDPEAGRALSAGPASAVSSHAAGFSPTRGAPVKTTGPWQGRRCLVFFCSRCCSPRRARAVEALYQNTYPEYLQYIYLVAPISLMMLNPLGFIFCEIQKSKDNRNLSHSKMKIVGLGLLHVLQNPIVFMVFIGIASNYILKQKIPIYLENFLDSLANSFSGSALFYLGLTMVGQIKKLTRGTFVALILLITAKLLLMPLLCREMVELLDKSQTLVNHTSLSNYAFLYGVFPTAPGVAIFATQFNMEVEVITSGMVVSTFVSAPIMYVSAWLLTIPSMDADRLAAAIQNVSFDISIVSLVSLIWSLGVILLSKKYKQLPHMLTTNLLIAQCVACIGMVMWNFTIENKSIFVQILVFVVLYCSLYSSFLWTGLLALSLLLLKRRETLKIPVGIITIAGWGIPVVIVGILLIAGKHTGEIDSAFFYGKHQVITTAVIVTISILFSGVSLMCMNRSGIAGMNYEVLNQQFQHQVEEPEREVNQHYKPSPTVSHSETDSPLERDFYTCQKQNGELCCSEGESASTTGVSENCSFSVETVIKQIHSHEAKAMGQFSQNLEANAGFQQKDGKSRSCECRTLQMAITVSKCSKCSYMTKREWTVIRILEPCCKCLLGALLQL
ncbi:integral membrane protein GPR155 isoform X2 [Crotalus tigris]|uniref:integral membrane protein GPR155 isoform X2 n=1 Tax=Crotalus tigris TaxID=88082 RepID=UPI00192F2305|nr:integral membrane protein GPR155 isoform X2 [Crotalus tigris]